MDFKTVLRELGAEASPLSAEEKAKLDHDGYAIFHNVFSRQELSEYQAWIDQYLQQHGHATDEKGCHRLYHILDKSPLFDAVWAHPKFVAAAHHIIKADFRVTTLNYRNALPDAGNQNLHSDNTWTLEGAHSYGQAIVAMVDFTEANGPTRLVPGSHRVRRNPSDEMKDTHERHPRQVEQILPAGSVIFFNGCLWHSGTHNRTQQGRPALHCGYAATFSDNTTIEGQRGTITADMYKRLSPAKRNLLDYPVKLQPAPTDRQFF